MSKQTGLAGKRIFVTGGSRGIGAAIALDLAQQGARVAISYSSQEAAAKQVVDSLPGTGHFALQMDLMKEETIEQAFAILKDHFQGLDGLVNNAGLKQDQLLLRMKSADFHQVIQANLTGAFLTTKLAIKEMVRARSGSVVQITSVSSQMGNPGQSNYAAAKAGLEAFTKSVANEVASRSVRLNCVSPGFIETDMTKTLSEEIRSSLLEKIPMGRIAEPAEVAAAVSFLLSDRASYITGHTLNVNGGLWM